jgi:hypothetical protein
MDSVPEYSGIKSHRPHKKKLISPLGQLPISMINWQRDILPEHLWIEFLRQKYSGAILLDSYSELCNALRPYCKGNLAFLGLMSDFGRIPENKRSEILDKYTDLIIRVFAEPFGDILGLYPKAPCFWLLPTEWLKASGIPSEETVAKLSKTVEKLLPGRDFYCGYLRMMPLRRLFEERKIVIPRNLEIIDLLPKYPNLDSKDRELCESIGRSIMGIALPQYINIEWAKYFWRRNLELSPCQVKKHTISANNTLDDDSFRKIVETCDSNARILSEYLRTVSDNYRFDLYAPEKDEVILGLFSRIIRLASSIYQNPFLWSFDFSRIVLRCLSDSTITFCYLILKDDDSLFTSFIEYGKGKEKLLLLHLQDTHPGKVSPSGETPGILADDLGGGVFPELIDINLGDWKEVSARDMAEACNLLDVYRIIYDPTSSDIHGTWTSIKNVNLTYCANPLHRFHRMPQTESPPIFLQPLEITMALVQRAVNFAQKHWYFPPMEKKLARLPQVKR